MGQKLIQTVNQMKVTCSYKNKAYVTNRLANGAEHWGFDCVKINRAKDELVTIWAQGDGIVLGKGTDQCYGNYVTVMYFDVEGLGNVVAN